MFVVICNSISRELIRLSNELLVCITVSESVSGETQTTLAGPEIVLGSRHSRQVSESGFHAGQIVICTHVLISGLGTFE